MAKTRLPVLASATTKLKEAGILFVLSMSKLIVTILVAECVATLRSDAAEMPMPIAATSIPRAFPDFATMRLPPCQATSIWNHLKPWLTPSTDTAKLRLWTSTVSKIQLEACLAWMVWYAPTRNVWNRPRLHPKDRAKVQVKHPPKDRAKVQVKHHLKNHPFLLDAAAQLILKRVSVL